MSRNEGRDTRKVAVHDRKALELMQGWTGGTDDPLYAISSTGGSNYAWVFEDAIANIDADLNKVKKIKNSKSYQMGRGTFSKKDIDELRSIRDALARALGEGEGSDAFSNQYMETALWSTNDESDESGGEPLDKNYSVSDIGEETRRQMISDCADFQKRFGNLIDEGGGDYGRAGHDFWLTRNDHGAGFWDGDWPEPQATALTNASKEYGNFDLYVGDDGQIHGSPLGRAPRAREQRGVRETAARGRWTVEAGRQLYFDGHPFAGVSREGSTPPAVADGLTHLIAELLNRSDTTPDAVYRRHMGHDRRRR